MRATFAGENIPQGAGLTGKEFETLVHEIAMLKKTNEQLASIVQQQASAAPTMIKYVYMHLHLCMYVCMPNEQLASIGTLLHVHMYACMHA